MDGGHGLYYYSKTSLAKNTYIPLVISYNQREKNQPIIKLELDRDEDEQANERLNRDFFAWIPKGVRLHS
jgi:hypothetical protein